MGGDSSKSVQTGLQHHQRLGDVKIIENQKLTNNNSQNEDITKLQMSILLESQKQYNYWIQSLQKIEDSQVRDVIYVPLKHVFKKTGFCGAAGDAILIFQDFPYVLQSEINNRHQINKFFIETQIWYIFYNMLRAGNKFEKLKLKIGNIHPNNIIINEDGQTKIISQYSLPIQKELLQNIKNQDNRQFLAPEQIYQKVYEKIKYPDNIDPCRAQVFSIGLTILSAGTLQNCDKLYIRGNNFGFNNQLLQNYLTKFSQIYSPALYQMLLCTLNRDPNSRKPCSQLHRTLYPYDNQILQLIQFNLPSRNSQPRNSQPLYMQSLYSPKIQQNSQYRGASMIHNHQPPLQQVYSNSHIQKSSYMYPKTQAHPYLQNNRI